MSRIKTLIAVKHALVAKGLKYYLYKVLPEPDIEVVDMMFLMRNNDEKEHCILIIEPDLISNPKQVTIEQIYKNYRHSKLISLSCTEIPLEIICYFDENLYFDDPEDTFIDKLRCAYNLCDENPFKPTGNSILSEREIEVLKAVALGHSNKEISSELSISTHTVITHRKNITSKLGIKSIAGLTVYAVLNNIISNEEMNF